MVNVSAPVIGIVDLDRMSGLLSTLRFDRWGNSWDAWGVRGERRSSSELREIFWSKALISEGQVFSWDSSVLQQEL